MSSDNPKLKIREAINLTNYRLNIRKDFINFLESTYGSQKHRLYLFSRNESAPKIFLLQMQVPVKFNNKTYDVSILVYFPLDFPNIEPEVYIEKLKKIKINPNCLFYIEQDTLKINYSCFFKWEPSIESFRNLMAELYNQFNMAFPVFNSNDKYEDINEIDGDCYLKKNLCREVELVNPIVEKNKINNNNNNNIDDINKAMNELNLNNNNEKNNNNRPIKKNIYGKPMENIDINPNKNNTNNNTNNNNNNFNNNNNNNNVQENLLVNPYQNKPPVFDEQKSKQALIKLLQKDLYPKINNAIQPITSTFMKLEKIKENIHQKLNEIEIVERKEDNIRQVLNNLHKELDFTISEPKEFERPDVTNLDTAVIISNKDYYMKLAQEKVIEEYILIVKKNYEKQNIDFNTALNLIRTNSRNIFFLKYKNAHRFGS